MIFLPNAHYAAASRISLLMLLAFTSGTVIAVPDTDSLIESVEISTEIKSEWSIRTEDNKTQKLELLVEPELEIGLSNDARITTIARLRADSEENISPGDHTQTDLRELYLDTTVRDSILIAGKQQIVWGKADGLKVLDVVNPQDFREFILDNFDKSRIPLWSVNTEIPVNEFTLQLLWIPDQTYHEFAEAGGTYAFTSPMIVSPTPVGVDVVVNSIATPDDTFGDADWGMRLSTFWNGWDLTINYLYHYNDTPVLFRQIKQTTNGVQVVINPEHKRSHLIGGTFSNTFGDLTLRGEVGYSTDRYIATTDNSDTDGVVKVNELSYVLGFDWYGFTDTLISTQLFQTYLDKNKPGMINGDVSTRATLLLKRSFLNETVNAEVLWLHDLDIEDGMVRPKITYELNDEINLYAGADIFYGDEKGLFGQFRRTDRLTTGAVIGF